MRWTYDPEDGSVNDQEGWEIARHYTHGRLIAAAPELLEALQEIMLRFHPADGVATCDIYTPVQDDEAREAARAAIEKATGPL